MRLAVIAVALLGLSGCQTPEQSAQASIDFCRSISSTSQQYYDCMMQRTRAEANQTENRRSRAAALSTFGNSILTQQAAQTPQPLPAPTRTNCVQTAYGMSCRSF